MNNNYKVLTMNEPIFASIDCAFCECVALQPGNSTQEFLQTYPDLTGLGQVLDVSESLVLIPDISPLVEDHLLLVTRKHYPSFASCPADLGPEVANFVNRVVGRLRRIHPDTEILIFEHGVGMLGGQRILCGTCGRTDHAHLHILPIPGTSDKISLRLATEISKMYDLRVTSLDSHSVTDLNLSVAGLPYLYVSSIESGLSFALIQESLQPGIPSQLIRKWLATKYLGVRENQEEIADWRDLITLYPEVGHRRLEKTIRRWLSNN